MSDSFDKWAVTYALGRYKNSIVRFYEETSISLHEEHRGNDIYGRSLTNSRTFDYEVIHFSFFTFETFFIYLIFHKTISLLKRGDDIIHFRFQTGIQLGLRQNKFVKIIFN